MVVSNELKKLYNRFREDKLAHAFLLETNNVEKCYSDVLELVKMLNCPNEYESSCTSECNLCTLVDSLNLPSLIVINPDGMAIKKAQVLELQERFATKPVYAKFNIYIVNYCDRLNSSSANTMLKFLEEPSDDIIGFFITTNKENVITTIKSRCQIIKVNYDCNEDTYIDKIFLDYLNSNIKEDYDKLYLERKDFIENIGERKGLEDNFAMLIEIFVRYNFYITGCAENNVIFEEAVFKKLKTNVVFEMIEILKKMLLMLRSNVSLDLILDSLYFEMREIYE